MSSPVLFPEAIADGAPESVESMLKRGLALGVSGLGALADAFRSAEARREPDAWLYREELRGRLLYAGLLEEIAAAKAAGDRDALSGLRSTLRALRRGEGDAVSSRLSGRSLELALALREGRRESLRPIYPKKVADKMEHAKCRARRPKQLTLPL